MLCASASTLCAIERSRSSRWNEEEFDRFDSRASRSPPRRFAASAQVDLIPALRALHPVNSVTRSGRFDSRASRSPLPSPAPFPRVPPSGEGGEASPRSLVVARARGRWLRSGCDSWPRRSLLGSATHRGGDGSCRRRAGAGAEQVGANERRRELQCRRSRGRRHSTNHQRGGVSKRRTRAPQHAGRARAGAGHLPLAGSEVGRLRRALLVSGR
jgi:hypothetical protein